MFHVGDAVQVRYHLTMREGKILEIKTDPKVYVVGFGFAGNFLRLEYSEQELQAWNAMKL